MTDLKASARMRALDSIDYWMSPLWILSIALWYWNGLDAVWACQYVAAYALWTLIEYWLHRSVFHNGFFKPIWRGHMHHHADPHAIQPLRMLTPILTGILFVAALAVPVIAPWVQGLIAGYWGYLLIHWAIHEYEYQTSLGNKWWQAGPYLRHIQRLHDRHHHANSGRWFGLHTLIWDHVFGTAEPVYLTETPLLREHEKRKGLHPLDDPSLDAFPARFELLKTAPVGSLEWFCRHSGHSKSMIQAWGGCTHQGPCPMDIRRVDARAPSAPGKLRGRLTPPRWNDK